MNDNDKIRLEVFADYVCPWCYLATAAIARLQREHGVEVQWSAFPLHPDTPAEGLSLGELFKGRDMSEVHRRLAALMEEAGLDWNPARSRTYNSRLAQELAKWAETQPGGDGVHQALYRAYFVHDRNLAETDVLLDVAESAGLDRDAAREALRERSFSGAVDADWQRARRHNLSGVPSFVMGGYVMTGCQPYAELERFLLWVRDQQARA